MPRRAPRCAALLEILCRAYADASVPHDPELIARLVSFESDDQARGYAEKVRCVLPLQPKNNDSRRAVKLIASDIRKAAIECSEDTILSTADAFYRRIEGAAKLLFVDRRCIPAFAAKESCEVFRQVLVDLELHQVGSATTSSRARSAAYAMQA